MARVYFEKPFDFIANKRGDTLSFKAGKTYTVTTPCADAAEKAAVGRRVDRQQIDDSTSFGPETKSIDQPDQTETGTPSQRRQGVDAFIRRVKK